MWGGGRIIFFMCSVGTLMHDPHTMMLFLETLGWGSSDLTFNLINSKYFHYQIKNNKWLLTKIQNLFGLDQVTGYICDRAKTQFFSYHPFLIWYNRHSIYHRREHVWCLRGWNQTNLVLNGNWFSEHESTCERGFLSENGCAFLARPCYSWICHLFVLHDSTHFLCLCCVRDEVWMRVCERERLLTLIAD